MRAYLNLWRGEERADGKEEREPLGRWEGHGLFVGTFASRDTGHAVLGKYTQGE
jgi:hypothetical protein